jgi:hypothetical protein
MALVSSRLLNKQVGGELDISEITVQAHRGQVMQKMHANSFADLIKMAAMPPIFQTGRCLYESMGRYYRLIDPRRHIWPNHPIGAAAAVDQHEGQAGPCSDPCKRKEQLA